MNRHFLHGSRRLPRIGRRGVMAATALTLGLGAWWALGLQAAPSPDVVDAQRGHVRALEAELTGIDQRAAAAASAHADAQRRVADLRQRIADTGAALRETRAAHAVAVKRLSDRLVAIYTGGAPPSLVEVLLTSGGLSAAVDAQSALQSIGEADAALVSSLEADRARLARLGAELQTSRGEAEANLTSATSRMAQLHGLLSDRRAVLDRARAGLNGLLAEQSRSAAARRASQRAVQAAGNRAEAALLRRADPGSGPAAPAASAPAAPAPEAATSTPGPAVSVSAALERIAQCESGGDPRAVSSNGLYFGKYQFSLGTWQGVGGQGNPADAPEQEQDQRAAMLYARSGPAPWPVCGYQ
jgi:peptidoglycan hydrolase CwlO-like protein